MSYLSDNETLSLPTMLPTLLSSELSPTGDSVNILINKDVMLSKNLIGAAMGSASTEDTYASHYLANSTAPFTSAGDVFLPSMALTSIPNTFVKPVPVFVAPTTPCRTAKNILNLKAKPKSRRANTKPENLKPAKLQSLSEGLSSAGISNQDQMLRNPVTTKTHRESSSSRRSSKSSSKNSSKKSSHRSSSRSSKRSSSRSHSSHSKSSSRKSSSKDSSRSRSTSGRSLLLPNLNLQSASVPASTLSGFTRSTATHTITGPTGTATDIAVAFGTETTHTTTTAAQAVRQRAVTEARSSLRAAMIPSYKASRTQSPAIGLPGTVPTFLCPDSSLTTTITSFTASRPRVPASIISPMQSTYSQSTSKFHSTHTPPPPATPATDRASKQFDLLSTQSFSVGASPTITADSASGLQTKVKHPGTISGLPTPTETTTTANTRHTHSSGCLHGISAVTKAQTTNTTTSETRALTHGAFSLPPGATFYTRKIPAGRVPQSRTIAVTTESQTYAISDGKGSYTTLTISSDFTTKSGDPRGVATTQCSAGVTRGHTRGSSILSDSPLARPRNQVLIPIANSQMSTRTSLGYLVTSPIGSEIITTHNSPDTTQSATADPLLGAHTITTLDSQTYCKIRSRLLSPLGFNVPSTVVGLGTNPSSTIQTDSNRSRGPVTISTIIANHLVSSASSRATTASASNVSASIRNMYSVSPSQSLYTRGGSMPSTTRALSATPTTFIISTDLRVSPDEDPTKSSHMVIRNIQNTNAATVLPTTTVATPTTVQTFTADGTVHMSSMDTSDAHPNLRSRLIVHVTTAENPTPGTSVPITAFALTRARAPRSAFAIPAGSASFSTTSPSDVITRNPTTMTLITFGSADSPATSSAHMPPASSAAHGESSSKPATYTISNPTPTLANTGNRFVIKLATSPSASPATTVSSVTSAVTTPITTATLNPPEHDFLEPQPVSRPRTFPGPRTYSVAQRLVGRATPKKMATLPAPLQIFADVVGPPTAAQSHAATALSKPRLTLAQNLGNSTLSDAQFRSTVYKNLSALAKPSRERASSSILAPRSTSDRLGLNRPVSLIRRSAFSTQAVSQSPSTTSSVTQFAYSRPLRASRAIPGAAADFAIPGTSSDPSPSLFDEDV